MTKPKHTPEAWTALCRDVNYNGGKWDESNFLQWEVEGPRVPDGRGDFFQDDAYVLAASKDMYEAGDFAHAVLHGIIAGIYKFTSPIPEEIEKAFWQLDAALAKARGERGVVMAEAARIG